jgi:phosphoribosyl-AMP cyclohydrolase
MTTAVLTLNEWLEVLHFDAKGLIPAIVQDSVTRAVLMMAWMNAESLRRTLELGETVFWSRSRGELWHKGGTSGNTQAVVELRVDCDGDTLLILVQPAGPACHTGATSCFFRSLAPEAFSSHSQAEAGADPAA